MTAIESLIDHIRQPYHNPSGWTRKLSELADTVEKEGEERNKRPALPNGIVQATQEIYDLWLNHPKPPPESGIMEIIEQHCVSREDYLALTPKVNDAQMDAKMLDANLIMAHAEILVCHNQIEHDKREIESLLTHARNALAYHITTKIALESRIKVQAETIQRYQSNPEHEAAYGANP